MPSNGNSMIYIDVGIHRDQYTWLIGLKNPLKYPADVNKVPIMPTTNLSDDFDWHDHGVFTAVKDQVCPILFEAFTEPSKLKEFFTRIMPM